MTENNTKFDFEQYLVTSNESYQIDDNTCIVVFEAPGFTKDDLTATLSLKTSNETKRQFYQLSIVSNEGKNRFGGFAKTKFAKFSDIMANYADKDVKYKFNQTLIVVHPADYNLNFAVDCVDGLIYVKIVAEKIKTSSDVKLNFGGSETTMPKRTPAAGNTEDKFDRINKRFESTKANTPVYKREYRWADFDDMFKEFDQFFKRF